MDRLDQVVLQGVDPGGVDRNVGRPVPGLPDAVAPVVKVAENVDAEPEGERGAEDGYMVVEVLVETLQPAQGQLVTVDTQDEREDL